MKSKGNIIKIILALTFSLLLIGCNNNDEKENVTINLFNPKKAIDVAENYLENIINDDLNKANSLCTEELLSNNNEINVGTSKIIAYAPDNLIESGNAAYVIFNVIRSSNEDPKCDLDSFAIKVEKENDDVYKISEVKSVNKKQVFVRNNGLRIIDEDGGESDLIVNLSNLPKDVYTRDNEIMIYKEKVPANEFGTVALSYSGKKIAMCTSDESRIFISIANIEKAQQASGSTGGPSSVSGDASSQSLEDLLDKPIAQKVVPVDILDNCKIEKFIFSREEQQLIVEYKDKDNISRMKIYSTDDGSLVKLKLEEKFPRDIYNINFVRLDKKTIYINVSDCKDKNITNEVTGDYKIDIEKEEIEKI